MRGSRFLRRGIAGAPARFPLVLAAGLALFSGGCGGDSTAATAPDPVSPTTPSPAPTPAPPVPSPAPAPVWNRPPVTHLAPLFPENPGGSGRAGFLRVVNYSEEAGAVSIAAFAEDGREHGPAVLAIGAGETIHLVPEDLVRGNPARGLSGATGSGWGDGRLELTSDLDLMVLSYIRHPDGFLTAMHDTVPREGNGYEVRIFGAGGEVNRTSRLLLINTGQDQATVRIRSIDDRGDSSREFTVAVPAGATQQFNGASLPSAGDGNWRLVLESDDELVVVNLMESPSGYLANLSTAPHPGRSGAWAVPLFPGALDPEARRGLLRIINHSARAGAVQVAASDDGGRRHPPFTLRIGAGQTVQLDSQDLEAELPAGSVADTRHLLLRSDLEIEVVSYVEHPDGFLTATHDVAPLDGHRVATFAPGGRLRLVNGGNAAARVTVTSVDDRGSSSGGGFTATVPPGAAREVTAAELGFGGDPGNRRLLIESEGTVAAMSLLEGPTGHLGNLSTEPRHDPVRVNDNYELTSKGNPAGVAVSVVDGEGFDPGTHGQRVTDTFLDHTRYGAIVQIGGWGEYALHGSVLGDGNTDGYVFHALTRNGGVFWTASDSAPLYRPGQTSGWFLKQGRPFRREVREFASWRRDRDVLFVSSLENDTCAERGARCVALYCDDFELDADGSWIPLCGVFDDYVAHSGVGLDTVLFAGALDANVASGAIRADGVFAPHTIYVEARDTSHATAVLAAYAVNLSFANPSWDAARLKRELMALTREENVDYFRELNFATGASVTERRTVRTIRRGFAP